MGCGPDIEGSHTFDETVPRILQYIMQMAATSEFAKPSSVPILFHRVAWVKDRRVVGQWGLFPATAPLEVRVQKNSVYSVFGSCLRRNFFGLGIIIRIRLIGVWPFSCTGIYGDIVCA